jgi:hypothetical protein
MNVIVDTKEPGFLENDWVGRELGIGTTVRLNVALPDPRCVMTTLAQDDLPKDTDILRTLARHNRVRVGDAGQFPCAGVYAVVAAPGTMRVVGKSHEIGTEQLAWLAKPEPEVLIIAGGWRELAGSGLEPSVFSRLAPHPDGIRGDRARRRYHT